MNQTTVPDLQDWVGRRETLQDVISLAPAAGLAATLDHQELFALGDELPPLWHWIYFKPQARQSLLGLDGHPVLGEFMPPIPLPRRMWAGGRLKFLKPLRIGDDVERTTEIAKIESKEGQQGALIFVTLRHSLCTPRGPAIEEEQDLVYRAPSKAEAAPVGSKVQTDLAPAQWRDTINPDPRLLFRYSALTFNTHRIHFDLAYAQQQEGYPGLVVQGPLLATLLVDRLRTHVPGRLCHFTFRGRSPLYAGAPFHLCGQPVGADGEYALWTEGPEGKIATSATATIEAQDAG